MILKRLSAFQYALEEYLATEPRHLKWMIKKSIQRLGIAVLRSWVLSRYDHQMMRRCGFFIEPLKLLKVFGTERLPVLVRPSTPEPKNQDFFIEGLDIRDINNWHIFKADSH